MGKYGNIRPASYAVSQFLLNNTNTFRNEIPRFERDLGFGR